MKKSIRSKIRGPNLNMYFWVQRVKGQIYKMCVRYDSQNSVTNWVATDGRSGGMQGDCQLNDENTIQNSGYWIRNDMLHVRGHRNSTYSIDNIRQWVLRIWILGFVPINICFFLPDILQNHKPFFQSLSLSLLSWLLFSLWFCGWTIKSLKI